MSRLGIRLRLLAVVIAAVTAALAALIVGFNLLLEHNLSRDADNLLRARAAAALTLLRPVGDGLVVGEAPDDAAPDITVWAFSRGKTLEAPDAGARVGRAARRLAGGPARFSEVPAADVRLYAIPVVISGRRLGTVVTGVSLAPYEQTRRTALVGSLAFGGLVLLLVGLASRWLLASSLRPVARMTRQAAAWSERDLERRFGLGEPHDELTELAATLDGLLDRIAASLRREQRFSAELSHELRTPLARVIAETELALRREREPSEYRAALEAAHRSARQVARTVDALVAAAGHEAGATRGTADAFSVATGVVDACAAVAAEHRVELELEQPARPIRLGVDQELAERILQPLVENACRYGRSRARVSIERTPSGGVIYAVEDDGPGVGENEREQIFEPGRRGRIGSRETNGAGLGLALARRLARSASGDVEAAAGNGGARFLVRLPAG